MYSAAQIAGITRGKFICQSGEGMVQHLVYDSRRIAQPETSLFFALVTGQDDGHRFLEEAYKKGVRNFVVQSQVATLPGSNIIQVGDTLEALQQLATEHRKKFSFPVIAITGSNGKTIVKEWLNHLLQDDHQVVRSPRSFNSQLGVPLSIWQMQEVHTLGIFEAGISRAGEMQKLADIIQPDIGILTNIGEAHNEGFSDQQEKTLEKARLFRGCRLVISPGDDRQLVEAISGGREEKIQHITWGQAPHNMFQLTSTEQKHHHTILSALFRGKDFEFRIPFTDQASIENAVTCCCLLLAMDYKPEVVAEKIARLHAIDMRLQLKHSFNDCLLINDSYSADITSLRIALDFLQQQSTNLKRTVILSEFVDSGLEDQLLYKQIAKLLVHYHINKVIAVGENLSQVLLNVLPGQIVLETFPSTEDFISRFRSSVFFREIILVKGARKYGFERIAQLFEEKKHQTVLEINLNALVHNLKQYQKLLQPPTKLMAMVKAFSYGSGGAEIASVLQFHHVDYLGVAYADEGADLVKAGISLPVMVMNAEVSSFQAIVDHNLQPVLYSWDILKRFETYLKEQALDHYPVHVELDTGMHRLGFDPAEAPGIANHIAESGSFHLVSLFSHLAGSEDALLDAYTMEQAAQFEEAAAEFRDRLGYPFLLHIANSAAIVRHPQLRKDMVRLGIGLYGIDVDGTATLDLQNVATLRSTIAQLREVKKGDAVSYNRKGVMKEDALIATIRIGYADGYTRHFGNGKGKMMVRGRRVPVVGSVCMDMTMIDVTNVPGVKEGDDVIIFGQGLPVQEVASWGETIPYELMTSVSQRVKRIYYHE